MTVAALAENFFVGVVSGLTASALFFIALTTLRPRIVISPEIARRKNERGDSVYSVKVLNRGLTRVTDVYAEMLLFTPRNVPNGQVKQAELLSTLERPQLEGRLRKSEPHANELTLTLVGPLEQDWDDNTQHVAVRVAARHGLSQFMAVTTERYYRKGVSIKDGQFPRGASLRVVREA